MFASIGKDKELKLWDLRNRDPLFCIDLAGYGEPDAIAINPEYTDTSISSAVVSHE